MKTRVTTVTCPKCNDEIYSRAHHDYHTCLCGQTMVDGGFDYLRYGGADLSKIKQRIRYVSASREELYRDWNERKDIFGSIPRSN